MSHLPDANAPSLFGPVLLERSSATLELLLTGLSRGQSHDAQCSDGGPGFRTQGQWYEAGPPLALFLWIVKRGTQDSQYLAIPYSAIQPATRQLQHLNHQVWLVAANQTWVTTDFTYVKCIFVS